MKMSENIAELAKSFAAAQAELKNPYNTADNPFYKSKYAPLPDLLNITRPVLAKHGLSIIQSPATDENGNTGVETMILHSSGQYILFEPYFLKPSKIDPQTAGGAITYARRYALNAALGISGEEDDDGNTASGKKQEKNEKYEIETTIRCPNCNKPVRGIRKSGKEILPQEVLEKLGMCHPCYLTMKQNMDNAENPF